MSNRYGYEGPKKYRPLSAFSYWGLSILYLIPVIGWFFLILHALFSRNVNKRGYARSYILSFLLLSLSIFILSSELLPVSPELSSAAVSIRSFSSGLVGAFIPKTSSSPLALPSPESAAQDGLQSASPKPSEPTAKPEASPLATSVSLDFKKAMDSYEAFFDSYIAFLKKYEASNHAPALLTEYNQMLLQYQKSMLELEAIDESKLSPKDLAYYTEVMGRINQKLLKTL